MSKCKYHTWTVYEEDTRMDICTTCGKLKWDYRMEVSIEELEGVFDPHDRELVKDKVLSDKGKWKEKWEKWIDQRLDNERTP